MTHGNRRNGQPATGYFGPNRTVLSWLFALFVGIVGTSQFHIVQFASRFDLFPGDRGDARLVAYLLEHWFQFFKGNNSLLSPPMFYPVKGTLGYADLLFGYAVPYSVLRSFGVGIFEASEFTIILLNFVNYIVCFVLLRKILRLHTFASCAGAAFFAFNSPKLVQLGHLQLQHLFLLPLTVILVLLVVQRAETLGQTRAFVLLSLAALSINLQLVTGFYPGWFFIFWCFLFLVLAFAVRSTRTRLLSLIKRFHFPLISAGLVFVVGLIPFVVVYLPIVRSSGGRPYTEVSELIPVLWSLLVMGERNLVWGRLSSAIMSSHRIHPELQIGIGLVPSLAWIGTTAAAVWFALKSSSLPGANRDFSNEERLPQECLFLALLVLATTLFYLLGMRYWSDYSPWTLVYSYFPGAKGIRAVARYVMVLTLPMSIAFAFVIDLAIKRISAICGHALRITLASTLIIVIAFGLVEQFASRKNFNGFPIRAETTYLRTLAASLPEGCNSFYVAVGPRGGRNQFEYQIDAVHVSILRDVPTFNGYSGQLPPNWALWEVKAPDYEANVKKWIEDNRLDGHICRLVIDETSTGTSSY